MDLKMFTAFAMQGILASNHPDRLALSPEVVAEFAVRHAVATLAHLTKVLVENPIP